MSSTRKIYLSLLIISGIKAMFSPLCMPMSSINPCANTGGSMLPDLSIGNGLGNGLGNGMDSGININCHVTSGGSMGNNMGTSLCPPPMNQPNGMIDIGFMGGMSPPSQQPPMNGIQLVCNSIGMPDKQQPLVGMTGLNGSSWGNDCYTKIGSIFMNGYSGGTSKLNDICCTIMGTSLGNKMLR
ncbi:hypothetical protein NEIRO02_0383 [Nematocida sp. AWRm79]|nr:hypothetical protein NEIRO02_0383 [Nematocida sp. AWRm79]